MYSIKTKHVLYVIKLARKSNVGHNLKGLLEDLYLRLEIMISILQSILETQKQRGLRLRVVVAKMQYLIII